MPITSAPRTAGDRVDHTGALRRGYRRDRFTWLAFAGLLIVGFFLATLGPALPYIRPAEHISYLPPH